MKTYGLVFIDLDETLLDFRSAARRAVTLTFGRFGLEADEEAIARYEEINASVWKRFENGEISQERLKVERFELLFRSLGLDADPVPVSAYYLERLAEGTVPVPHAERACAYLSAKYPFVVVTNGIKEVQYARIAASPIGGYVSDVVVSGEVGLGKPDPAIFELAAGRQGYSDRDGMIMIGDSLSSDIRGGAAYGIDTCWYNPSGAPNDAGPRPTHEIRSLAELEGIL